MSDDPYALAQSAAEAIRQRFSLPGIDHAYVLGSGWSAAADDLGEPIGSVDLAELPGFSAPVVAGHGGQLRLVATATGRTAAVLTGRTHRYEGRGEAAVVHGELLALAPFGEVDGIVARAAARLSVIGSGLDPKGLVVPEVAYFRRQADYQDAAAAFATGEPDGVAQWIVHCCTALETGAREAKSIADAVQS